MRKKITALIAAALCISSLTAINVSAASSAWQNDKEITTLLSELKIMQGDNEGNFKLDEYVTRAEMAKIAVAASSYKNTVAHGMKFSPFSDVPSTFWGASYIRSATDAKIVTGYIDGTFRPNETVTFEEAVTMMLKVLGYTDEDFGASYPYGQIGTADGLKMTEGMNAEIGVPLTRRQVAILVCNTLDTKNKTTGQDLIAVHDCQIIEDVTIIAGQGEDSSLSSDEISTTNGKYRITSKFDESYIGCSGDMIIRDGKYLVSFSPDSDKLSQKYIVYSTLNDAILCYNEGDNNNIEELKISDTVPCYKNSSSYSYGNIRSQIEMGDILRVHYKDNGEIDYVNYTEGDFTGPVKVTSADFVQSFNTNSDTKFMRDGKRVTNSDIQVNDIIYYSDALNMVMAYTNNVTGIYENASPSKDQPTSVTISGVSYEIEGIEAFRDLSSSGSFNFGDTVTILLGKDGSKVAGVVSASELDTSVEGYVIEAGKKEFTNSDNTKYTSYYINIVTSDGTEHIYRTSSDKSSYITKTVRANIKNGIAEISTLRTSNSLSGEVSYSQGKIGNMYTASNINILDVSNDPYSEKIFYTKIYMQRLDGLNIDSNKVVCYETNENNEISSLILKNVTNDMFDCGIVVSSTDARGENGVESFTIESNGSSYSTSKFNLTLGVPTLFAADSQNAVYAQSLKPYNGTASKITQSTAVIDGKSYLLSDKVKIFKRTSERKYLELSLNEAINGSYSYTCYYDKAEENGGRIRAIVVTEK